jgi:importin subunit beta-1
VSPVEKAKRGASNAISRIATIEVPRGEWQDLIVTLLNNTTNVNEEFKRTSLMTVGFICEQFKQHSVTLPQTLESTMLATLIQATRDPQVATKLSALKAIRESLGFMSNVLAQKSVRDHIFALLLDATKERETVEVALQGISEFVKINFEHMDTYIIALFDATFPLLTIPSNITISALDIWDYIGF